jgi:hypothetical protein
MSEKLTFEQYHKLMAVENAHKYFDDKIIAMIGYRFYIYILEWAEEFEHHAGSGYQSLWINNRDYCIKIMKDYGLYISKIARMTEFQKRVFVARMLPQMGDMHYFNQLNIIDLHTTWCLDYNEEDTQGLLDFKEELL